VTRRLSPAERDVLRRLAQGATLKEIAAARGRSIRTIEQQSATARRKLEARTLAHAVHLVDVGSPSLGESSIDG